MYSLWLQDIFSWPFETARYIFSRYIFLSRSLTLQLLINIRVFKLLLALWASNKYQAGQRLHMICCGQKLQLPELS